MQVNAYRWPVLNGSVRLCIATRTATLAALSTVKYTCGPDPSASSSPPPAFGVPDHPDPARLRRSRIRWTTAVLARDTLCTTLEIVCEPADQRGFNVISRRWVVERTLAWLTTYRRPARDHERDTAISEAIHPRQRVSRARATPLPRRCTPPPRPGRSRACASPRGRGGTAPRRARTRGRTARSRRRRPRAGPR